MKVGVNYDDGSSIELAKAWEKKEGLPTNSWWDADGTLHLDLNHANQVAVGAGAGTAP